MENMTSSSEKAKTLLDLLPAMTLTQRQAIALTRGAIQVQERLQLEPSIPPSHSDLIIVAKYAQMIAEIELGEGRNVSALTWADVALKLWDDAVVQSLTGAAILELLPAPGRRLE